MGEEKNCVAHPMHSRIMLMSTILDLDAMKYNTIIPGNSLPNPYVLGIPGKIGGASTKIALLLKLLHGDFKIMGVPPGIGYCKDRNRSGSGALRKGLGGDRLGTRRCGSSLL
jgi:hypothetical protein